jgi:hypothetical protein
MQNFGVRPGGSTGRMVIPLVVALVQKSIELRQSAYSDMTNETMIKTRRE